MSSSTYIDLHNMSEVYVDTLTVNTVNTDNLAAGNALIGTETVVTSTIGTLNTTQLNVTNETITGTLTANIINATTETVSGVFTATNNTTSTVSRSNQVYVQNTSANQEFYLIGVRVTTSGYDDIRGDLSGNISFNPNTHRLTIGYINATTTELSTFNGQVQCSKGEWISDTPSIILGTQGTTNQGVIQMWGNANTSILVETSSSGDFELYQKVGSTASYLMKFTPTVCNIYADMNLTSGHVYKINNVTQTFLNQLTTTPTTTITHTFVSPNLQSNINNLSITDGLIANTTISNGKLVNSSITLGNTTMALGTTNTTIGGNMTWTGPTQTFSPMIAAATVINVGNTLATSTSQITMRSLAGNGTIKQDAGVLKLDGTFISLNSGTTTGYVELYSNTIAYKPILIPYGVSNIVTPSGCDAGLIIGDFNTTKDGGLILESATSSSAGSTIQQNGGNLYIDNHSTSSINIGMKTTTPTINIGGTTVVTGTIKGTKVTGTDSTSNITNLFDSVASVGSGVVSSKDGVIHLYSATNPLTTGGGIIQINNNKLYIDSVYTNGIYIGTRNFTPVIVEEISLVSPSSNYSIFSPVTSVYPSAGPVKVYYNNIGHKALVGSCTTNLISPDWTRITGTNTLEVSLYIADNSPCSFKIEGQINSYYTSTNTGTNINCKVFRDAASTATATGTAGFVNSLFINRNISGGSNVNTVIPFSAIYTSPSGYPGECYTFTMYFQSITTFTNGSTVGRSGATPDVPSVLIVTQLD